MPNSIVGPMLIHALGSLNYDYMILFIKHLF